MQNHLKADFNSQMITSIAGHRKDGGPPRIETGVTRD